MKNVVVVVLCVGCENVVELCGNVEVVKMWASRSRAEMLLKLCKNVEVVKNVGFSVPSGNAVKIV